MHDQSLATTGIQMQIKVMKMKQEIKDDCMLYCQGSHLEIVETCIS